MRDSKLFLPLAPGQPDAEHALHQRPLRSQDEVSVTELRRACHSGQTTRGVMSTALWRPQGSDLWNDSAL